PYEWFTHSIDDPSHPASRVSLIGTLVWQASREGGGMFNLQNAFWNLVRTDWLPRDSLLLIGGTVAIGINLLLGFRNRRLLATGLLGALPLVYLGRGDLVLNYYILFAIPFLCLNLAALVAPILNRLPVVIAAGLVMLGLGLLARSYWQTGALPLLYEERPDIAGRQATTWLKENIPAQSLIIGRDNLWTDLHEPGRGGPAFTNFHSHWKVALDPEIRNGVFRNDWRTVDYLLIDPDLAKDFKASGNTVALQALENAHLVKRWAAERGNEDLHPQQIMELWKVDKVGQTERMLLADSRHYLRQQFERDGAYLAADGSITSEAQSYAMLRAVWSGDRASFDSAWAWTQSHLLDESSLPAWLWQNGQIKDNNSATDANTDMALALLMAGKYWDNPELLEAGRRMVQAIWEREVVVVGDDPYITAGNWAGQGPVIALNPSYFAPYAYRIFQEVDSEHDWLGVVETGYRVVVEATESPLGHSRSAGLPPDWVGLNRETGELVPLELDREHTTHYGYDAARTYWRIALDWRWSRDGRAKAYLEHANFLRDEVNRLLNDGITYKHRVSGIYAKDGAVVQEGSSLVSTAGAMAALLTLDADAANTLYAGQIVGGINRAEEGGVYWDNPNDLYTQEWGWFATALYANTLPNLWHNP
ncbi:MAG: glycosyl hydrolase family 8, partial [Anaerolineae bacterium]